MPSNNDYLAFNGEEYFRLMWKYNDRTHKNICIHAMDIFVLFWFNQDGRPFHFDPEVISKTIRIQYPFRKISATRLRAIRPALEQDFFKVLPDGRWIPAPELWLADFAVQGEA